MCESTLRPSHELGEIVNKAGLDEVFRRIGGIERLRAGPEHQAQADSDRDNWSQNSHYGLIALHQNRHHAKSPSSRLKGPSNTSEKRTTNLSRQRVNKLWDKFQVLAVQQILRAERELDLRYWLSA